MNRTDILKSYSRYRHEHKIKHDINMSFEEITYIAIHYEMNSDPLINKINSLIVDIKIKALPEKIIISGNTIEPVYSEKVNATIKQLEDFLADYIKSKYTLKDE